MWDKDAKSSYCIVYGLFDPQNSDDLRYVGVTGNNLKVRLQQHYLQTSSPKKHEWLHNLRRTGSDAVIREIDRLYITEFGDYARVIQLEKWWIAYFASLGAPLFNCLIRPRKKAA